MKRDRNNFTSLNSPQLNNEEQHLISCLQSFGEGQSYFEIKTDLLAFAMPVLLSSKIFAELPTDRRKELFNQYSILSSVLVSLLGFISDYPSTSKDNSSPKFHVDAINLISCLQSFGEVVSFFEINFDLVAFIMPELVGSDTFIELPGERRAELFDQYSVLRSVLDLLSNHFSQQPGKLAPNVSLFSLN